MLTTRWAIMQRKRLTDPTLQALKRAPSGKRYEVGDLEARGLVVRVNERGVGTFVLRTRLPGSKSLNRLTLGEYPGLSLSKAREQAREWRDLLAEGKDPRVEIERRRQAELRRQAATFESVCEDFFADIKRRKQRRAHEVERDVRREFIARWGKRPVTDIDWADVKGVIDAAIKRNAPWQAHHLFGYAQRLFGWAREQGTYGLTTSPCDGRRPAKIIGTKEPRTRVLTDDELRALWQASGRLNYPLGPLVRLLILTGQRKSEVAEARWDEIDLKQKVWNIPVLRMKAKAAHTVPLTDDVLALLKELPRFDRGDHLFSTTFGLTPVNGFSKAKRAIDTVMLEELKKIDPKAKLVPWVLHDVRRSMRTHLSALPVPDMVRELIIGHTQKGLHKIYDQHSYLDEKRHALELWSARLRDILTPPPANVVKLKAR
jgi:integrase